MRVRSISPDRANRRGAVLLGVVIVIVILALIGYHYSDRMVVEYQGAANAHRAAQLRRFADSGVHYAAMMLSSPENISNYLGGNPYDNPSRFGAIRIGDMNNSGEGGICRFIAPLDPDQMSSSGAYRAGVTCEASKININAFIKRDPTGEVLFKMLQMLPSPMNLELAASIVDYVDADTDTRENGAEDDYYSGSSPSMRCKNGPLDSLDELLLVKGMTREILYGSDLNHNGVMAPDGSTFGAATDRGLSAFLTIYSRESNRDATGQPLINLNGDDLTVLSEKLGPVVPVEVVNFIILMREYGPTATTTAVALTVDRATGQATITAQPQPTTVAGNLANFAPDLTMAGSKKLTSLFDLVTAKVTVPAAKMGDPATVYSSPMMDLANLGDTLSILFQVASLNDDPEIPARINLNTAPREVLLCVDGLSEANVDAIITNRPSWSSIDGPSAEFQSLGWLAAQAGLSLSSLKNLEKVLTTRSTVFHMQIVGQFENGQGPTARVEAIVDANYGRPRIVFYRDWSELGRTKLPE